MTHFEWLELLPFPGSNYLHIANMLVICFVLLLLSVIAGRALKISKDALVPAHCFSVKAFF